MKPLTKTEIEQLTAMGEDARESWIKEHRQDIDFDATYRAIDRLKIKALSRKHYTPNERVDSATHESLMTVAAHLQTWDEQYHSINHPTKTSKDYGKR